MCGSGGRVTSASGAPQQSSPSFLALWTFQLTSQRLCKVAPEILRPAKNQTLLQFCSMGSCTMTKVGRLSKGRKCGVGVRGWQLGGHQLGVWHHLTSISWHSGALLWVHSLRVGGPQEKKKKKKPERAQSNC